MLVSLVNNPPPAGIELMNPVTTAGPELDKKSEQPTSNPNPGHGTPQEVSKMLEIDVEMKDHDDVDNCSNSSHSPSLLKENEVLQNNSSINEDEDKDKYKKRLRNRSGNNIPIQTQINKKARTSMIEPKDPVVVSKSSANSSMQIKSDTATDEEPPEPVYDNTYKWELDAVRIAVGAGYKYSCLVCNRVIRKKSELFIHRFMHTGERPFSCKFCSTKFVNPYTRNIHIRTCAVKPKLVRAKQASTKSNKSTDSEKNQNVPLNRTPIEKTNKNLIEVVTLAEPEENSNTLSNSDTDEEEPSESEPVYDKNTYRWELDAKRIKEKDGTRYNYSCLVCKRIIPRKSELFFHRNMHTGEKPYSCKYCLMKFYSLYIRNIHIRKCTLRPKQASTKSNKSTSSEKNQIVPLNRIPIEKTNKNVIQVVTLAEPEKNSNTLSTSSSTTSISRENKRPIKLTYKAADFPSFVRQLQPQPVRHASKSEENLDTITSKKKDSMARLSEQIVKKIEFEQKTDEQSSTSTPLSLSPPNRIRKRTRSSTNSIESSRKLVLSISKVDGSSDSNEKNNETARLTTKKRKRNRNRVGMITSHKKRTRNSSLKPPESRQRNNKVSTSPPNREYHGHVVSVPSPRSKRNTDTADIIKALEEMGDTDDEQMHLEPDAFSSKNEYYAPAGHEFQEQNMNMFSLVAYEGEDMGLEDDLYVLKDVNGKIVTFDQVQILDDEEYDDYIVVDTGEFADYPMDYQEDYQEVEEEEGELFPCSWCEKVFKTKEFKNIHEKMSHSANSGLIQSSTLDQELDTESAETNFELEPPIHDLEEELEVDSKPEDEKQKDSKQTDLEPADKNPLFSEPENEKIFATVKKSTPSNLSDPEPANKKQTDSEQADKKQIVPDQVDNKTIGKKLSNPEPPEKKQIVPEQADKKTIGKKLSNPEPPEKKQIVPEQADKKTISKKLSDPEPVDKKQIIPEQADKKTISKNQSDHEPADKKQIVPEQADKKTISKNQSDPEPADKKHIVPEQADKNPVVADKNPLVSEPTNRKTRASTTAKNLLLGSEPADKKGTASASKLSDKKPTAKNPVVSVVKKQAGSKATDKNPKPPGELQLSSNKEKQVVSSTPNCKLVLCKKLVLCIPRLKIRQLSELK